MGEPPSASGLSFDLQLVDDDADAGGGDVDEHDDHDVDAVDENRNEKPMSDPASRRSDNDDEKNEGAGDQQEQEVGGHRELVVG